METCPLTEVARSEACLLKLFSSIPNSSEFHTKLNTKHGTRAYRKGWKQQSPTDMQIEGAAPSSQKPGFFVFREQWMVNASLVAYLVSGTFVSGTFGGSSLRLVSLVSVEA